MSGFEFLGWAAAYLSVGSVAACVFAFFVDDNDGAEAWIPLWAPFLLVIALYGLGRGLLYINPVAYCRRLGQQRRLKQ